MFSNIKGIKGLVLLCVVVFLFALNVTLIVLKGYFNVSIYFPNTFLLTNLHALLILPIVIMGLTKRFNITQYVFGILLTIFVFSIMNHLIWKYIFWGYGDKGFIQDMVIEGVPFTRWLTGSVILNSIYSLIWTFPPLLDMLSSISYLKIVSTLYVGIFSIYLLTKYRNKFSVIISICSAMWFMFLVGYEEYYPYIAPLLLFILGVLFEGNIINDKNRVWQACCVFSVLPLIYIGFVPISLIVLIYIFIKWKSQFIKLMLISICAFIVTLNLSWGSDYPTYFSQLYKDMNFGSINISDPTLINKVANENSIFYNINYLVSKAHLKEMAYSLFFGGGASSFILIIVVVGIVMYLGTKNKQLVSNLEKNKFILLMIIVIQQLLYFIFMLPKLGLRNDIDMFFSVYLICNFSAGYLIDKLLMKYPNNFQLIVKSLILAMIIGYQVEIFYILTINGLPNFIR